MSGKFVDGKFVRTPDPEIWELSTMECRDLALWLEGAPKAHVMITEEGVKFKFGHHELAVWSRGLGKKV